MRVGGGFCSVMECHVCFRARSVYDMADRIDGIEVVTEDVFLCAGIFMHTEALTYGDCSGCSWGKSIIVAGAKKDKECGERRYRIHAELIVIVARPVCTKQL